MTSIPETNGQEREPANLTTSFKRSLAVSSYALQEDGDHATAVVTEMSSDGTDLVIDENRKLGMLEKKSVLEKRKIPRQVLTKENGAVNEKARLRKFLPESKHTQEESVPVNKLREKKVAESVLNNVNEVEEMMEKVEMMEQAMMVDEEEVEVAEGMLEQEMTEEEPVDDENEKAVDSSSGRWYYVCCGRGCLSSSRTSTLHPFPASPLLAQAWLEESGRLDLLPYLRTNGSVPSNFLLCSEHFSKDQYTLRSGKPQLKRTAVPCHRLLVTSRRNSRRRGGLGHSNSREIPHRRNTSNTGAEEVVVQRLTASCLRKKLSRQHGISGRSLARCRRELQHYEQGEEEEEKQEQEEEELHDDEEKLQEQEVEELYDDEKEQQEEEEEKPRDKWEQRQTEDPEESQDEEAWDIDSECRRCADKHCQAGPQQEGRLYRFPKEADRCLWWLENLADRELLRRFVERGPLWCHHGLYLCASHFQDSCFFGCRTKQKGSAMGVRLVSYAVPTLFVGRSIKYPCQHRSLAERYRRCHHHSCRVATDAAELAESSQEERDYLRRKSRWRKQVQEVVATVPDVNPNNRNIASSNVSRRPSRDASAVVRYNSGKAAARRQLTDAVVDASDDACERLQLASALHWIHDEESRAASIELTCNSQPFVLCEEVEESSEARGERGGEARICSSGGESKVAGHCVTSRIPEACERSEVYAMPCSWKTPEPANSSSRVLLHASILNAPVSADNMAVLSKLKDELTELRGQLTRLRREKERQRASQRRLRDQVLRMSQAGVSVSCEEALRRCRPLLPRTAYQFLFRQLLELPRPHWGLDSIELPLIMNKVSPAVWPVLETMFRLPNKATLMKFRSKARSNPSILASGRAVSQFVQKNYPTRFIRKRRTVVKPRVRDCTSVSDTIKKYIKRNKIMSSA